MEYFQRGVAQSKGTMACCHYCHHVIRAQLIGGPAEHSASGWRPQSMRSGPQKPGSGALLFASSLAPGAGLPGHRPGGAGPSPECSFPAWCGPSLTHSCASGHGECWAGLGSTAQHHKLDGKRCPQRMDAGRASTTDVPGGVSTPPASSPTSQSGQGDVAAWGGGRHSAHLDPKSTGHLRVCAGG